MRFFIFLLSEKKSDFSLEKASTQLINTNQPYFIISSYLFLKILEPVV